MSPISYILTYYGWHALQVFIEQSMPIIEHYEQLGKVKQIKADRDPDDIYKEVSALFKDL